MLPEAIQMSGDPLGRWPLAVSQILDKSALTLIRAADIMMFKWAAYLGLASCSLVR